MKWKHVYVATGFFYQLKVFPTSLKPDTWNSFCLKVNSTSAVIKLNREAFIIHRNDKSSSAYSIYNNYRFMNDPNSKANPMFGAMTDLHVWDKILSEEDSELWKNCTIQRDGNIFSWQNSSQHVQLTGLEIVTDSLDNICYPDISSHMTVGNEALTFKETLNYCNNKIGSNVVISSKETAVEVNKTLESFAPNSSYVYTGHTNMEVEGRWVVHGTQQEMAWENWRPGEPNNFAGNEKCAVMHRYDLKYEDRSCMKQLVPVCNLSEV